MNNHKNINEIMKSWGRKNQKVPPDNAMLKNKILSKIPFSKSEISWDINQERKSLPWPSLVFATLSVLVVLGNSFSYFGKSMTTPAIMQSGTGTAEYDVSEYSQNKSTQPIYSNGYELPIKDTREFLKISYNAAIRTRDVINSREKVEITVRGFGGRIDSSSGNEKHSYISFAVPADKFEMFRQEIKSLAWGKLFTENTSSNNLLPQKQSIEIRQKQAENTLADLKSERGQLIKSHTDTSISYQLRIDALNRESGLLQNEWQTAPNDRKLQITSRLAQIQTEKNILQSQYDEENNSYQTKLTVLNNKLKNAEANVQTIKTQDKNLMENVSTVNGYIYLNWISLWEMADLYTPGPLLAWILMTVAVVLYWRRYVSMNY